MFTLGQAVYTKNSGVCIIVAQEEKDFGVGVRKYFVLEPVYPKGQGVGTKTFISETTAANQMRNLINKDNALKWLDYIRKNEKFWIADAKARKQKFEEIYITGELNNICLLIKSLYLQNEELKTQKKTLSMYEKEFLDKMTKDLLEELSIVLDETLANLQSQLEKTLNE